MGQNILISCITFFLQNQNFDNLIPPDGETICHNIRKIVMCNFIKFLNPLCLARKKVAGSISVYRGKAKQLSMSFHYHDCVLASGDFGQGFSITLLCYEQYRLDGQT